MSFISDFKSAPFSLTGTTPSSNYTSTATPPTPGISNDPAIASLCGTMWRTADGRIVTIVQVGATAIDQGLLVQSPAQVGANHTDLVTSTQSVGDTTITVTLGGTRVYANEYAGGWVVISADTAAHGMGQMLKIASHPAQSTTTGNVVLTLEDPLTVATVTGSTTSSLILPQYGSQNGVALTTRGVIVSPTTPTGRVIGATIYPLAASTATVLSYGFIVVNGAAAVVASGAVTIGTDIQASTGTAGNVMAYTVSGAGMTSTRVGVATVAGQSGKAELVTLQL